jgi:hypothetical protein
MRVFVCLDETPPVDSVSCSVGQWVEYPSGIFSGWSSDDLAQISGAVLVLWAIVLVFRVLHRWAQSDIN